MLTKNEFVKAITAIKHKNDKLDKEIKNSDLRIAFCEYSLQDDMIALLESAMNIPVDKQYGSIISWWIYEDDFGKKHWSITDQDENGKVTETYLTTAEDLYNYCKDMSIKD